MEKELKKSYRVYTAWNYEKEENFINENSNDGWQLVKGGCFHSVYEKDDSNKYVYKIDYNPETMKKSIEKKRYIEMFEDLGWEYINSTYNGWNYFRKEYNENSDISEYEIYTDHTSYKEMLGRWCKLGKVVFVVELIFALIYTFISIKYMDIIIGIEAILFWGIFLWIKKGLDIMNEKMEDK
ncbi:DUF2812 domain-containing protein [Terrisporobacter glycolicus]|uniref:DUF2812 domain-containing protein n=1 Tax=Terrisporobacter glycolicus ATCC 14880 = DSM 1288 TaxID=1121315 RepID=A0ABZ2EZ37_9FIRM|nr:DUF2812 domain-containing protein [Terrisporobacter glycolicus]